MKALLKEKILEFQNMIPLNAIPREAELPVDSGKIISVSGVRRSGKTYVLYDTINRLVKNGLLPEQILFLSFDDERLQFKTDDFDLIMQAYKELFPDTDFSKVYVFFDEVQMADGWEQFVRRIYDSETKNIFISGSNSKLLATDIATSLRGRTLPYEIFPLSFSEYCTFRKLDTNFYISANKVRLVNAFKEYNRFGGFPELVLNNYMHFEQTLQEYYHIMLYKDLVERYQIHNLPVLKYFVNRLLANLSKPTSVNKIYNEIKSAGLKTDKNALYMLSDQLEAIYFTQKHRKYDLSVIKTELATERKMYFIDNGMVNALNYSLSNDYGKLLENTVYLWLRRQTPFQRGLYFYKGKKECDFVKLDREKPLKLIQACWDVSDADTLKREVAGLTEAARYMNCDELMIITSENETEIKQDNFIVKVVPAWKALIIK